MLRRKFPICDFTRLDPNIELKFALSAIADPDPILAAIFSRHHGSPWAISLSKWKENNAAESANRNASSRRATGVESKLNIGRARGLSKLPVVIAHDPARDTCELSPFVDRALPCCRGTKGPPKGRKVKTVFTPRSIRAMNPFLIYRPVLV